MRLAAVLAGVVALAALGGGASAFGQPPPPPPPSLDLVESFELTRARVKPRLAFFDARRMPELRYRFRAEDPIDLRIDLVTGRRGDLVRRWLVRGAKPGERQERSWNGLDSQGRAMPDGRYSFWVGPAGGRARYAGSVQLRGHRFPVPGSHSFREGEGDFGAPRSGGRVHEGKDVWAPCGAPLVAARGGRVARRGHDPVLYGHYLVVDARGSRADHFYVHLAERSPALEGERVRTGERIGAVGRSGNAASVGCQLHFELWPRGFRDGAPIDPEPLLRRWDGWS